MKQESQYFEETKKRMQSAGWKPHAIRTLFNNGIVDDVNEGRMTLIEGRMHYPAIDSHPCLTKK
jgi:hypothetical protein